MRNALRTQDLGHPEVFTKADIVVPDPQHDPHSSVPFEEPRIVDVRNEIDWVVEIEITVVVAIHKWLHVERATHCDACRGKIRVLKCEVQCVVATEAASGRYDLIVPVQVANQRNNLLQKVLFVGDRASYPVMRVNTAVIPALTVHAVDAKELEIPIFDLLPDGVYHPGVLVFVEPAL